ncbi:MAG: type II toxin-antitoxin system mRNA interferase toxin, RelE/StbE family [bacterium]|nr:type II toxin-antitoxin system mRNA interferase toxin, RelE/StbE family [bacterium]
MFAVSVTETFVRLYKKLPSVIQRKAAAKTDLFRKNPFHPSLRTKKLEPHQEEIWSFWIDKDYRIKFRFADFQNVHFLFVGNRKDVYQ